MVTSRELTGTSPLPLGASIGVAIFNCGGPDDFEGMSVGAGRGLENLRSDMNLLGLLRMLTSSGFFSLVFKDGFGRGGKREDVGVLLDVDGFEASFGIDSCGVDLAPLFFGVIPVGDFIAVSWMPGGSGRSRGGRFGDFITIGWSTGGAPRID